MPTGSGTQVGRNLQTRLMNVAGPAEHSSPQEPWSGTGGCGVPVSPSHAFVAETRWHFTRQGRALLSELTQQRLDSKGRAQWRKTEAAWVSE